MSYFLIVPMGLLIVYGILLTSVAVFAPKVSNLTRTGYLLVALMLTAWLAWVLFFSFDLNAGKLTWSTGSWRANFWNVVLTRPNGHGDVVVPTYWPILSLIPIVVGAMAGLAMRRLLKAFEDHKAKQVTGALPKTDKGAD